MAKPKRNGKKNNGGIVKLKIVVEKLQKSLLLGKKSGSGSSSSDDMPTINDDNNVPDDVKEGHFAVIAMDDDELKRFVIPLSYLTHPTFLRLLEQAAEEYGFNREGALTIPCRPSELEKILSSPKERDSSMVAADWDPCAKTMVKSF